MNTNFSVLMSLYKKENPIFLKEAIDSVFNNSLLPSEVVLVKDGPLTPGLESVLKEYLELYKERLRIISLEENRGLGIALNIGLKHCTNELVARMDTDDICFPNRFESQVGFMLLHPEVDVLGSSILEFSENKNTHHSEKALPESDILLKSYLKYRNPFNHMTVMFRKSKVLAVGGYKDFYFLEDYFLWIRMFFNKCTFHNLQTPLVYARADSDMIKRRGGVKYFMSEKKLLKYMYKKGVLKTYEYIFSLLAKTTVRLMGGRLRGLFYKYFLRRSNE